MSGLTRLSGVVWPHRALPGPRAARERHAGRSRSPAGCGRSCAPLFRAGRTGPGVGTRPGRTPRRSDSPGAAGDRCAPGAARGSDTARAVAGSRPWRLQCNVARPGRRLGTTTLQTRRISPRRPTWSTLAYFTMRFPSPRFHPWVTTPQSWGARISAGSFETRNAGLPLNPGSATVGSSSDVTARVSTTYA